MLYWVGRRVVTMALTFLVISLLVYLAMSTLGGDAAVALLGPEASPEALEALREDLGLNRSFVEQYLDWLGGILSGDLGNSVVSGSDMGSEIVARLQVTLPLALMALTLTVGIALPVGILGAARRDRISGVVVNVVSQVGISIPAFWAGLLLVAFLAVEWQLFPAGGFPGWQQPAAAVQALLLPAVALAVVQASVLTRYVRSAFLELLHQDYMRTARAGGLTLTRAMWLHGLRNAAIPIVTIAAIQFAFLISGAIVIENVFYLPGLGRLLVVGIEQRDVELVQNTVMVFTGVILLLNFATDLLYGFLDPRMRRVRT